MCTYIYEHDVPAQSSDEKAGQKTCNKITVTVVLKSVMKLQLWEQLALCKRGGEQLDVLAAPLPYFPQTLTCLFVRRPRCMQTSQEGYASSQQFSFQNIKETCQVPVFQQHQKMPAFVPPTFDPSGDFAGTSFVETYRLFSF